jgi:hypothetical protein
MGPVHKNRGAVRFGADRDQGAGPDNPRKEKKGKEDGEDGQAIDTGQIDAGPDAKDRFKAQLFKGFRLRGGGYFVFPVFPHTRIIGKGVYLVNERNSCYL